MKSDAQKILDKRLASGEISLEEYARLSKAIKSNTAEHPEKRLPLAPSEKSTRSDESIHTRGSDQEEFFVITAAAGGLLALVWSTLSLPWMGPVIQGDNLPSLIGGIVGNCLGALIALAIGLWVSRKKQTLGLILVVPAICLMVLATAMRVGHFLDSGPDSTDAGSAGDAVAVDEQEPSELTAAREALGLDCFRFGWTDLAVLTSCEGAEQTWTSTTERFGEEPVTQIVIPMPGEPQIRGQQVALYLVNGTVFEAQLQVSRPGLRSLRRSLDLSEDKGHWSSTNAEVQILNLESDGYTLITLSNRPVFPNMVF